MAETRPPPPCDPTQPTFSEFSGVPYHHTPVPALLVNADRQTPSPPSDAVLSPIETFEYVIVPLPR